MNARRTAWQDDRSYALLTPEIEPTERVLLEQAPDEVTGIGGQARRKPVLGADHTLQGAADGVCVERGATDQHGVQHAPQRPDVGLQAVRLTHGHLPAGADGDRNNQAGTSLPFQSTPQLDP